MIEHKKINNQLLKKYDIKFNITYSNFGTFSILY